jgi:hypothetical protein
MGCLHLQKGEIETKKFVFQVSRLEKRQKAYEAGTGVEPVTFRTAARRCFAELV